MIKDVMSGAKAQKVVATISNNPLATEPRRGPSIRQTGPILAGAIWALGHAGVSDQEERDRARPGLSLALAAADSDVRGAALWTAARLGLAAPLQQEIRGLVGDDSSVCLLIDGAVQELKIGDLAAQVLNGLTTTIKSP